MCLGAAWLVASLWRDGLRRVYRGWLWHARKNSCLKPDTRLSGAVLRDLTPQPAQSCVPFIGKPCRTMSLVGGFSRGPPSGTLAFQRCYNLISFTLVGSQDFDVKSQPSVSTPLRSCFPAAAYAAYAAGRGYSGYPSFGLPYPTGNHLASLHHHHHPLTLLPYPLDHLGVYGATSAGLHAVPL
ncbi:hypothetical protein PR048_017277 [Dryococelus australis]|uniref:Uncharacterized protein n=1 Tax=Dryococelus australis TaxID=614101 RepID=A0ABQ9H9A5_9NEOP|nr:hypothetical protein PR048_017277 [Dryococelus australis]